MKHIFFLLISDVVGGWTLRRTPGYMRVYKLTDSDKYCLNVEIINNLTKIEPLNNYLMD